ncbi:MAG: acetaldehyde dehydrogenase (acetylating) [Oscillospiraceae bacterium]|nr:acetaldehyde dehydrogenase (acetylating) [Oscillospiraceae bacterium]
MEFDKDLRSIQEVRDLVAKAKAAQEIYAGFSQSKVDNIVKAVAEACAANAQRLAKMAVEETGFGVWQDKILKNLLGSAITYDSIKDLKTVGVLSEDNEKKVWEVAVPMGIVAALIPSTNPTSTVMYKTLISLKSGNAIILSPHPNAKNCILETFQIISRAAAAAGAPAGLVQCITVPSQEGTSALLKHRDIGIILATGGEAMVRAAYSSGNPALGVGPGNGPAYIEKSADIIKAVKHIFDSKTFDNGTICASEQSIITERCIKDKVVAEVERQGGYFMTPEESDKVSRFILRANGTMNPKIVGKSAQTIAEMAGIKIPAGTRILLSHQTTVGKDNPYSREKLCPILAFYTEDSWESACKRSIEILNNEGVGHTMTIHSEDMSVIREFALKKPVSRLLVNTPGALGGVGASTGLQPALTLGCGSVGGSATSDNVGPMHLINIRRVAFGIKELSDIRGNNPAPDGCTRTDNACSRTEAKTPSALSRADIEAITKAVIDRLSR